MAQSSKKLKKKGKNKAKRKLVKAKAPQKAKSRAPKQKVKTPKPIGVITHFYGGLKVGIAKFNKSVKTGTQILIKGATTNFKTKIGVMQYNYKEIKIAPKGKQVGLKVGKRVRVGDKIFES